MTMCKIKRTMAFQNWPHFKFFFFLFGPYQLFSRIIG